VRLSAIDPLICLAVWTYAAFDSLDEPEGNPHLLLPGVTANWAVHAALRLLTILLTGGWLFHEAESRWEDRLPTQPEAGHEEDTGKPD